MEIYSITTNLSRYGGAQKVLLDVHNGLKVNYSAKIIGFQKFQELHSKYKIGNEEYIKLNSPFQLNNKILIVHARNVISIIMILKFVFRLNTKVIYVSHNVYNNHQLITFLPRVIVSISNKVTDNLKTYFNVKEDQISLIYNGIKDNLSTAALKNVFKGSGKIVILYPARVNVVKRQIEIVNRLNGKLNSDIEIHFAGTGPDYDKLVRICNESMNFKALGFIENIEEVISKSDFLMLYSTQEGLPISLIEGVMLGKPLLVNDVGGNLEIGIPGSNAILLEDNWDKLADTINAITHLSTDQYDQMSRNSQLNFKKKFTVDDMISNYSKLIDKIANS